MPLKEFCLLIPRNIGGAWCLEWLRLRIGLIVGLLILFLATSINTLAQTETASIIEQGKAVYEQNCLACHQIDGSGVPQLTPSLVNASFVSGDKSQLIKIILNGMKDVEINGEMYDNPMPPFAFLTDEDIAAVLTYVRNSFTNKASVVKKDEVAVVRKGK